MALNREQPLVFLLSCERSGSTLLSQMLGRHPGVFAPPELHLLRYRTFDEWLRRYPQAIQSLTHLADDLGIEWPNIAPEGHSSTTSTIDVLASLLEHIPPGTLLVDKTPAYSRSSKVLRRMPDLAPRYVWLVRHVLPTALSRQERTVSILRTHRSRMARSLPRPAGVAASLLATNRLGLYYQIRYWTRVNQNIRSFLAQRDARDYALVRFEELVQAPKEVMEGLCGFLGLRFNHAMTDPYGGRRETIEAGLGDPKFSQLTMVDAKRARHWRESAGAVRLPPQTRHLLSDLGFAN